MPGPATWSSIAGSEPSWSSFLDSRQKPSAKGKTLAGLFKRHLAPSISNSMVSPVRYCTKQWKPLRWGRERQPNLPLASPILGNLFAQKAECTIFPCLENYIFIRVAHEPELSCDQPSWPLSLFLGVESPRHTLPNWESARAMLINCPIKYASHYILWLSARLAVQVGSAG